VDIERAQRINRTLELLDAPVRARSPLRPIELLVIAPSQRLDDIAARHVEALPPAVRTLLRGVGVGDGGQGARGGADASGGRGGAALASYLLFEEGFTRELIALGVSDTMARRDEVIAFFDWPTLALPDAERDPSPTAWATLDAPG
jgi:NTE family protein